MDTHRTVRVRRGCLGWAFDPDDWRLRRLVDEHGPAETYTRVFGGLQPAIPPRAELAHLTIDRLVQAASATVENALATGARIVIPEDDDWPAGLAGSGVDPVCLWARGPGPLPQPATTVTVVGARAATGYGEVTATDMAAALADAGYTIVSDCGYGIAAAVVRGVASVGGGALVAVQIGLDRPHPLDWRQTLDQIAATGLLLSAWPPGVPATRTRAIVNRSLLAALSGATVLVEAARHSRSLHTVRAAAALGRHAMVVPGPVTSATSAGCHDLLRSEPRIRAVTGPVDIVTDITGGLADGDGRDAGA